MQASPAADWYAQHGKMPRLYVPAAFEAGHEVVLPEGPARHVTRVLRLGEGATLVLFDGHGQEAGVRLTDTSRKQTSARIEAVTVRQQSFFLPCSFCRVSTFIAFEQLENVLRTSLSR